MKFSDNPAVWVAMALPLLASVGGTPSAQVTDLMATITYAMVLALILHQNSLVDRAVQKLAQRGANAISGAEDSNA